MRVRSARGTLDLPLGSAVPPLEEALHVHDGTRAHEEHPIVRLCLHAIFVPVIRGWSIKVLREQRLLIPYSHDDNFASTGGGNAI